MSEPAKPIGIPGSSGANHARIHLYFDSHCPLCSREVAWIQGRKHANRVALIDIAAAGFDASESGRSYEQLMGTLHARTASGEWFTGMDAIRSVYRELGMGAWAAPTAWPLLRPIFDALYTLFAKIRPYLQRHPPRGPECADRCTPLDANRGRVGEQAPPS